MQNMTMRLTGPPLRSDRRTAIAVANAVTAAAHVPVIAPHLREAPYMGVLFIALALTSASLGALLLQCDGRRAYALTAGVGSAAVIGYAATRLTAFPLLGDDVGNWFEPLGVVSVTAESVAVMLALLVLVASSGPRTRSPKTQSSVLGVERGIDIAG